VKGQQAIKQLLPTELTLETTAATLYLEQLQPLVAGVAKAAILVMQATEDLVAAKAAVEQEDPVQAQLAKDLQELQILQLAEVVVAVELAVLAEELHHLPTAAARYGAQMEATDYHLLSVVY
jgi:hypothetical protein